MMGGAILGECFQMWYRQL